MTVSTAFDRARQEERAALVGYLPAGFPDVDGGIAAMRTLVDAGCDVIEVGLPYSDPVMDGPTIQAAAQQALERGVRTKDVLRTVEAVAATASTVRSTSRVRTPPSSACWAAAWMVGPSMTGSE